MNSPVRLGVSPTAASTPTGVFSQRFEALFPPHWNSRLYGVCLAPLVCPLGCPPGLSAHECGTAQSASHCLACPGPPAAALPLVLSAWLPSPPLLQVWMNVFSLTPWLLDFHTVQFSVSSGCFLFLNVFLSFIWLCKEAPFVYLGLHLGQKSP